MTVDLKRYDELKRKTVSAQREADRAAGALEKAMGELKAEFKVDSLDAAETLEAKLKRQADKAERQFNRAMVEFDEKWGKKLEGE